MELKLREPGDSGENNNSYSSYDAGNSYQDYSSYGLEDNSSGTVFVPEKDGVLKSIANIFLALGIVGLVVAGILFLKYIAYNATATKSTVVKGTVTEVGEIDMSYSLNNAVTQRNSGSERTYNVEWHQDVTFEYKVPTGEKIKTTKWVELQSVSEDINRFADEDKEIKQKYNASMVTSPYRVGQTYDLYMNTKDVKDIKFKGSIDNSAGDLKFNICFLIGCILSLGLGILFIRLDEWMTKRKYC